MEQTKAVFDAARPITLKLRTPEGVRTIGVRFPTDEEWIERQRRRKVLIKQLGRGVSETVVSGGEDADAALLARIRQGEGPDVDPFEASRVIDQLGQCDVDDVVQEGDAFRVTLRVIGGTVEHVLRMPSAKDVFDYRRAFARVLDLPYNRQELTVNLAAGGALFKKLSTSTDGYASEPPIIHQAVAVRATIDALEATFQEAGDPN
jgi:hypothetical protein